MSGKVLEDVLERDRAEKRREAMRALLRRPLMTADDAAFTAVRRQADELRRWLQREAGWDLRVEGDFARLLKRPADHRDDSRPATARVSGAPQRFTRRRYALFCLALAVLERGESQTALGRLGDQLVQAAADLGAREDGGRDRLEFTLSNRDDRRDLVSVIRLLLDLGVLARVAGDDEEDYVRGSGDALYDVHRRVLAALMVCPRGPSLVVAMDGDPATTAARLEALHRGIETAGESARNQALRQALTRRLLDDPVVYYHELGEDERAYLQSQRAALLQRVREMTGLESEVRAEGIAMVDAAGELTDRRMPSEGTEGHATLLLATWLAKRVGETIPRAELEARMRQWIADYGRYWKKAARDPGAETWLCGDAIRRLADLNLLAERAAGVEPLPAIGRYAVDEPRRAGRLFEEEEA